MRVLMINPNRYLPYVAPIGLEYVCNSLLRKKIEFDIIDLNFNPEKDIYKTIKNSAVDFVGISIRNVDACNLIKNEYFLPPIKRIVAHIRKTNPKIKIALGGAGFSHMPDAIMDYLGADFGVVGYGEAAFPELIEKVRAGETLSRIDNLVWRNNGRIEINESSKRGFEKIPGKRRNLVRTRDYYNVMRLANIEIKRGCTRSCGYCKEPMIVGRDVAQHDIREIIVELKELKALGVRNVVFCDSALNVGPEEFTVRLAESMARENLDMTWAASIYPDKKLTSKWFALMKKSGCRELAVSLDSGSEEMLASMGKWYKNEDSIACSRRIKENDIHLIHNYLIGWPGESLQTIEKSIRILEACKPDLSLFYMGIRIFPDTRIAQIARKEGLVNEKTDFLTPIFYKPEKVLNEFLPYLRRRVKGIPGCAVPNKQVDLMGFMMRNLYLRGYDGPFSQIEPYMMSLPGKQKLAILLQSIIDNLIPSRRYIPTRVKA